MTNYTCEYLKNNPQETKRLLGISYEQLEQLREYALFLNEQKEKEREKNKIRIHKAGGGRQAKISKEEQIILTLIYLRHYLSFQLWGLMFQISESTAHNYFNYWQEIFRKALPASLLEQVKKLGETEEDISQTLTNYELLIDSEEQPVERPSSYSEQKKHYSGKKKTKTKKNQIISLPKGADIVHVVAGELGPKSDIRICRENLKNFDNQQKFSGDKAYVGEKPIKTPKKKPKNEELTEKEKEVNKKISSTRIFIEHLIRIIKIFKITQERFRLNKSRYKSIFLTVCGLVRLRINALIIEIIKPSVSNKEIQIRLSHTLKQNLN